MGNQALQRLLSAPGEPLDAATRSFMEPRFGRDLSDVRVHADPEAAGSADSFNARAYAIGHHVAFAAGEYRPQTASGRRLLAHELVHVAQQQAGAPTGGAVVQRDPKTPAKNTAAGGPKLDFRPAKNSPPCACIVFIHHNEPNARLAAHWMHELCRYNLAVVAPQTGSREIDLPGRGTVDPNELFPRKIAEECWADDKPCEDFLTANAGATKSAVVEEFAQRQFFLAVKKCSSGFALPVVALHNNTIDETARYRQAVRDTKAPLDLTPIRGKTFEDALKAGEKSTTPNTSPFVDLRDWLLKNVPGVSENKKAPAGAKNTLTGDPITPGLTNIFLWCSAADVSRCQIGDPERPDNVVWVTNPADFEKLRGSKTNVVLQTRVDPKGRSATDLSSLFVFLEDIIGTHYSGVILRLLVGAVVNAVELTNALLELDKLKKLGTLTPEDEKKRLDEILLRAILVAFSGFAMAGADVERTRKLSQLRFVNIETPQRPTEASTSPADLRVQSFRDVRATLALLGLDCCDAKPAAGATESAVDKVEKALREGKLPEAPAKKAK